MFFKDKKKEIEKQVAELREQVMKLIDKNDWMELYGFARLVETEAARGLNKYGSRATEEEIVTVETMKLMCEIVQKIIKKIQKDLDG